MRDEKDICMFCDEEIEEGDKVECKKCKSVYHKTCFDELQHVCMECGEDSDLNEKELKESNLNENITYVNSSLNQNEQEQITQQNSNKNYCTKCGEIINEGQLFCGKCGAKIENQEVNQRQKSDEKVNKGTKSKSKKKYIIGIISVAIIIVVAILINNSIEAEKQAEARNEYLESVKTYETVLLISGINLEDIADTTQKYWHENIFENKHGSDINEAIQSAFDDKSSQISKAREYDENIKELYTKLKDIPEGSEDLSNLLNIVTNSYNSYTDFYDLAMYPEGNYTQYSENNNKRTNDFLDDYRELKNYIETDKEFDTLESESDTSK